MHNACVRWLVLVVLAACDSPQTHLDAQRLSLDVVVRPARLVIYTNSTHLTCDCSDEIWAFPPVGTCLVRDDVNACGCPEPQSCLTTELRGTGVVPPEQGPGPLFFQVPSPFPPDLVLEIGGCGHPPLEVPIEPFVAPTPTLTVDKSGQTLTAQWQTDTAAASAAVEFSFHLWGQQCHTTASELAYLVPGYEVPPNATVGVTTFLPLVTFESPSREVRVWRGSAAYVTVP